MAKDLVKRRHTLTARDAIHCAVVITSNLKGDISADKDFDNVKDIQRFSPEGVN